MSRKLFRERKIYLEGGNTVVGKYPTVCWPDHPMARSNGSVFIHQVIAYEKFGDIPDGFVVHHEDEDKWNWCEDNVELITLSEHASLHARRLKAINFVCPWCDEEFSLDGQKLHDAIFNRLKGKAGPFCGRSCAGKYGAAVKHGKIEPLDVEEITPEYYTKNSIRQR